MSLRRMLSQNHSLSLPKICSEKTATITVRVLVHFAFMCDFIFKSVHNETRPGSDALFIRRRTGLQLPTRRSDLQIYSLAKPLQRSREVPKLDRHIVLAGFFLSNQFYLVWSSRDFELSSCQTEEIFPRVIN